MFLRKIFGDSKLNHKGGKDHNTSSSYSSIQIMVPFFFRSMDDILAMILAAVALNRLWLVVMSYLIYSHMIVDGAKPSLNLENHEFDLRVVRIIMDHHLDLVVRWFLKINEVGKHGFVLG